jgi:hypothetical protein
VRQPAQAGHHLLLHTPLGYVKQCWASVTFCTDPHL